MKSIHRLLFDTDNFYRSNIGDEYFFTTYQNARRFLLNMATKEKYKLSFPTSLIEDNSINIEFVNQKGEILYASIQYVEVLTR